MSDTSAESEDRTANTVDGALSPGTTATGGGTSMGGNETEPDPGEIGTTEADVSDGREQKLPKIPDDASRN